MSTSTLTTFQEILHGLVERPNIRQAIAAVKSPRHSIEWVGTAAASNSAVEKPNPDTPFFLASIDKLFNATITMKLYEKGLVDLEQTIVSLLSSDVLNGLHVFNGTDYTSQITIRHLLTHTSGLPDWLEESPKGGKSLVDQVLEEGDRPMTFEQFSRLVAEDLTPHFPPQDLSKGRPKIRYSDSNFILLIRIIEKITGNPLHKVHQDLLYEPLGLNHTYFPGQSEPLAPTPPGMPLLANGKPIEIPHLLDFLRGIYSNTGDMLTFMQRLTGGVIFEKPETLSLMMDDWLRFGFPLDAAAMRSPGWPIEYGKGIMRFQLPRLFTSMMLLPPLLGHTGSTGCWLFWSADDDAFFTGSVGEVTAGPIPFRAGPLFLAAVREIIEKSS